MSETEKQKHIWKRQYSASSKDICRSQVLDILSVYNYADAALFLYLQWVHITISVPVPVCAAFLCLCFFAFWQRLHFFFALGTVRAFLLLLSSVCFPWHFLSQALCRFLVPIWVRALGQLAVCSSAVCLMGWYWATLPTTGTLNQFSLKHAQALYSLYTHRISLLRHRNAGHKRLRLIKEILKHVN